MQFVVFTVFVVVQGVRHPVEEVKFVAPSCIAESKLRVRSDVLQFQLHIVFRRKGCGSAVSISFWLLFINSSLFQTKML